MPGPTSYVLPDTIPPDSVDTYLLRNDFPVYPTRPADTLPPPGPAFDFDTVTFSTDSLPPPPGIRGNLNQYVLSRDSLDAPVDYAARDSQHIDFRRQEIHLFGEATVTYQDVKMAADHIILNWSTSVVTAEPLRDSLGRRTGMPTFNDATQQFEAKQLRYNFKTQKGIITDAMTTQDDIILRGGTTKFIGGGVTLLDTTQADVIYAEGGIFTTCTADHPHFGIRTSRAKMIPNKVAVIGPSNLEIMGIPTPLWLPFGFFPLKSGRSTGLIFPGDYEYSPQWGFGLRDFGWFFPLGEHLNLTLLGNYYLKGTYGVGVTGNYRKRYKYSGSFNLRFDKQRTENQSDGSVFFEPSFNIRWSHRQDRAAHPTANFSGTVNFQTNLAQSRVFNSALAQRQNVINSNVNFTKNWEDLPITLTAGLSHSQSNRTREITVNFPQIRFQTQTIYPFRRAPEKRAGAERWYEQINFRYRNELRGTFVGSDTTFISEFGSQTVPNGQYGFRHDIATGMSFKVLKYFTVTPNINYEETYYPRRREFEPRRDIGVVVDTTFDEFGNEVIDTSDFGTIIESLERGIFPIREFSAGVGVNTQLFGTLRFRKGPIRGLRHIMKPSINFGYAPDYLNNERYYTRLADTLNPERITQFDRFRGEIFGSAPRGERQVGISYGLINRFEAKVWNKRDSTTKNIQLLQDIRINGSYNFQAEEFKWSPIRFSTGTSFFKQLSRLSVRGEFDPYERIFTGGSPLGERVNITTLSASQVPFKLTNLSGTLNTNLTVAKIRQLFQGEEEEVVTDIQEERRKQRAEDRELYEETDLLSLFENFSISHQLNYRLDRLVDQSGGMGRDTLRGRVTAHTITLRGRIQLTENWMVDFGQLGYDFVSKRPVYPYLSLARDLHCWEMRFSWAPQLGTYNFSIGVKPGTMDFLNVPYRQNRFDATNQIGGRGF